MLYPNIPNMKQIKFLLLLAIIATSCSQYDLPENHEIAAQSQFTELRSNDEVIQIANQITELFFPESRASEITATANPIP